jgi:hypothetical protein
VGQYPPYGEGSVQRIAISGDHAYVAFGGAGLQILDIRNPAEPQLVAAYDPPGNVVDVAVQGNYAYLVLDSVAGLQVVDISNPVHPRKVGGYYTEASTQAYSVNVSGTQVCLSFRDLLEVIDISTPTKPQLLGRCGTKNWGEAMACSGHCAYVVDYIAGVEVFDISDPSNPRSIGTCLSGNTTTGPAGPAGIEVSGNLAYIVGVGGLSVIDVSTPASPTLAGVYRYGGGICSAVTVVGEYAYGVCPGVDGSRLEVIDITDEAAPRFAGEYQTDGWITRLRVSGNFAHVLENDGSKYEIIDISSPASLKRVGVCSPADPSDYWSDLQISGNHAYVTGSWHDGTNQLGGVQVMDLTDVAHPSRVGACITEWLPERLAVAERYACVVGNGLQVIDLSEPTNPRRVGEYPFTGPAGALTVVGNYVYLVANSQLLVIDITDPAAPQRVGSSPLEGFDTRCWEIAVSGRHACVAANYGGVLVFDVSDPTHPRRIGRWATRAQTLSVAVVGRYAYAADSTWEIAVLPRDPKGLVILDLENPACLERLGSVEVPRSANEVQRTTIGVAAAGRYSYLSSTGMECDASGCHPSRSLFHVIDTSDPTRAQRVSACDMGDGEGSWHASIALSERTAYVVEYIGYLRAIDLSDAINPKIVRGIGLDMYVLGLAVSGDYLYVAGPYESPEGRFQVFNAHDLERVGLLRLPKSASGVALAAPYAYVAGENLEVIDISQPSNPRRVAGCQGLGGGSGGGIAVLRGRACVVGDMMLRVFDVAEPTNPQLAGECALAGRSGSPVDVAMAGDYAYVAGNGVEVFDIRDPAHPRRVGGNSAFDAHALAIADGRLYAAAGEQGLVILDLYQPPRFESLHLDREGFHLLLRGPTGQIMRLDRSRDLRTWEPFATVPIPAGGQALIDPAATSEPFLFYRAVSVP